MREKNNEDNDHGEDGEDGEKNEIISRVEFYRRIRKLRKFKKFHFFFNYEIFISINCYKKFSNYQKNILKNLRTKQPLTNIPSI